MRKLGLLLIVACGFLSFSKDKKSTADNTALRLNQIQIIASHNSYHVRTDKAVFRFLHDLYAMHLLPQGLNPRDIDYTNCSLTEQFQKYGVRGIELDIYYDPQGGRYYKRGGRAWVWQNTHSHIAALKQPGFKIIHIPDFDYNTTNYTFKSALTEVKKWSDEHPSHLPIFINVETKTSTPGDEIHQLHNLAKSVSFDSVAMELLDGEVKAIFGDSLKGIITPDKVRGNYGTLEQAVLAGNWTTLSEARGKVVFIIDAGDDINNLYKKGHPSYSGRAMFVYTHTGTPEAAFVICNQPLTDIARIHDYVQKGYIVRTRSDEGTHQARTGDCAMRNAAFASWAQIISTDYYRPDSRAGQKGWTDYHVQLPQGVGRVDSLAAPTMSGTLVEP